MTKRSRLPVSRAACPACGADDGEALFEAPAQLIDLEQTFRFSKCRECRLVYLVDRVDSVAIGALYDADYPLHRGPALWGPFARFVADDNDAVDAARVSLACSPTSRSGRMMWCSMSAAGDRRFSRLFATQPAAVYTESVPFHLFNDDFPLLLYNPHVHERREGIPIVAKTDKQPAVETDREQIALLLDTFLERHKLKRVAS